MPNCGFSASRPNASAGDVRASSFERQPTQPECRQDEDGDLPVEDQTPEGRERRGGGENERAIGECARDPPPRAPHDQCIHGDGQHVPDQQRRPICPSAERLEQERRLRRIHGGVEVGRGLGHERDLRIVQGSHVVERAHLLRLRKVAERVEVHEVGALQRTGDAAIAGSGESDDRCSNPDEERQQCGVYLAWRSERGQRARPTALDMRDRRSPRAITGPVVRSRISRVETEFTGGSSTRLQDTCLATQ